MAEKHQLLFVSPSGAIHRAELRNGIAPPEAGEIINWGRMPNSWVFKILDRSMSIEEYGGENTFVFTMKINSERPFGWLPEFEESFISTRHRR